MRVISRLRLHAVILLSFLRRICWGDDGDPISKAEYIQLIADLKDDCKERLSSSVFARMAVNKYSS